MKVFYHNDMDGKCAAHVINSYDDYPTPSSSFYPINYGKEFPFGDIEKSERIYILDYSIEPKEMERLLNITEDVIWIDHHKTAIDKYKDFLWVDSEGNSLDLLGIRDIESAGCCLAYNWVRTNRSPYQFMDTGIPFYIRLVGDRDTWQWKYGDTTKRFFAGLEAEDTFPRAPIWNELRWDNKSDTLNKLVANGRVIQKYKDQTQQDYIKENGFWVKAWGYKCYAVNGRYSSQQFEVLVPEADIWLTFRYMPEGYWMVTLYSDKVKVREIAERYEYHGVQGGGHDKAAGFECEYPPFLEIELEDIDYSERRGCHLCGARLGQKHKVNCSHYEKP